MNTIAGYSAVRDAPGLTIEGEHRTGRRIWDESLRVAGALTERGVWPGGRVVIPGPTDHRTLTAFLGSILAGAAPCLVAPPTGAPGSMAHLQACVAAVSPHTIISWDGLLDGTALDVLDHGEALDAHPASPRPVTPEGTHHLQLTSGSTSTPKAVVLSHKNVDTNVRAVADLSGVDDMCRPVSWLPLYHDMGLVQVLTSLRFVLPMSLIAPTTFLRRPLTWLTLMGEVSGTHTAAPPFAYHACTRAVRATGLPDGLDLSSIQQMYVGAEPISGSVLHQFAATFEAAGFNPSALTPCYGLAESVLAVTVARPHPNHSGDAGSRLRTFQRQDGQPGTELVSCGEPVPGVQVRVVGDDGDPAVEGVPGRIEISGDSVADRYLTDPEGTSTNWRDTGDLGFFKGGELYVTGRAKEVVIVHGRNYMPYDIETVVESHELIGAGHSIVMNVSAPDGREHLVALVETKAPASERGVIAAAVRATVRQSTGLDLQQVQVVPRGGLPRTTSGKRQRALARKLWERELGATGMLQAKP